MLTTKEQQLLVREVYKTMKRKKGMTLAMVISYYRDCADFLEEVALDSQND